MDMPAFGHKLDVTTARRRLDIWVKRHAAETQIRRCWFVGLPGKPQPNALKMKGYTEKAALTAV
ncbi:hypothetical protein KIN20_007565 [Parelaphostrongylus tenuis]|uniref:Uncharacterized protein n=1 Tax=Parelaphostrongylus tenuis TaxID=148309 RepID=A0AAD5MMF0_PARTN|nr:hypothetical protein KIN20_007565 [Parelaphostrongylus tenuis]